ncbi:MAG: imidazole glycerol phosphate synthase subunit HisH [Actinomycetes bacterium]
MIAILDYGSGNLRSAQRAFELTGHDVRLTSSEDEFLSADACVVPGVGAFGACMDQLASIGGVDIVRQAVETKKPIFGICVGMQIFFSEGTEKGNFSGLGFFEGSVDRLQAPVLPHIGWNNVECGSSFFEGLNDEMFYFVHSYAATQVVPHAQLGWTTYGERFIASIERDNIFATQFHPEKSGSAGALLIQNWAKRI